MNRHRIARLVTIAALGLTASFTHAFAAELKPLSKGQAVQLLASMGYEDVEVGAVVQGFAPMTGSQNVATVLAIGRRKGEVTKLEAQFFYDTEIGWFHYEYDDTRLRTWTLSGYKEFRPKMSLTDSSAAEMILGSWKADGMDIIVTYTTNGQWRAIQSGSISSGSWKLERGTVVWSQSTPTPNNGRTEILSLDKSALVVKVKTEDGSDVVIRHRKISGQ